jgi:protein-S-isoprenylcysteine O-methyltransferase Ste14
MIQIIIFITSYALYLSDNIIRELLRRKNRAPYLSTNAADKYSSLFTVIYLFAVLFIPAIRIFGIGNYVGVALQTSGIFIQIVGLVVRVWSLQTLGRFYTGQLTISTNHRIITSGPYRYIRHPGYLSVLIQSIGFGLATGNLVCMGIIILLYFCVYTYRIHMEEKMLIDHFGEEYGMYSKRTSRVIPFIW